LDQNFHGILEAAIAASQLVIFYAAKVTINSTAQICFTTGTPEITRNAVFIFK